ncbi:transmembrane protein 6/97 [Halenospora varia]|nr:transmembrane protein 6/97 [Halenospora varia]
MAPRSKPAGPRSIWTRKADMLYIVILAMLSIFPLFLDFIHYSPIPLPKIFHFPLDWFKAEYNDPLYTRDPPFFKLFIIVEAVYLLPMSLWCIRGLVKDSKMVPLHLLVLSTHIVSSTAVCGVEMYYTKDWPQEYLDKNLPGYVIFGALSAVMWADMYSRTKNALMGKMKSS